MDDHPDLHNLANEKISIGKNLISMLNDLKNVPGIQKIQRKINHEIRFLENVKANDTIRINHVLCSNLTHYEFLVKVLLLQNKIKHIDCSFPISERSKPLRVDIVCDDGLKWIKVIARNTRSINDAVNGRTNYGAKSVLDQANEYLLAASENLCLYKPPKIVFYFSHTLDNELIESLKKSGIEVKMNLNVNDCKNYIDEAEADDIKNDVKILNLDITTMLAYISELTNDNCNCIFKEKILTEQAENERKTPLKPILEKLFHEKKLICCETALKSFNEIVNMLAGPKEKQRAINLVSKLEIFPDVEKIPDNLKKLNISAKIKPRSLKMFAFGIEMKSITVTSNEGFIRSSKMQGIDIPVFIHQARALTENKEKHAIALK